MTHLHEKLGKVLDDMGGKVEITWSYEVFYKLPYADLYEILGKAYEAGLTELKINREGDGLVVDKDRNYLEYLNYGAGLILYVVDPEENMVTLYKR